MKRTTYFWSPDGYLLIGQDKGGVWLYDVHEANHGSIEPRCKCSGIVRKNAAGLAQCQECNKVLVTEAIHE